MKILVVSFTQVPPIESGSQKCIFEYCELLKSLGFDVHFLYIKGFRSKIDKQLKTYWGDKLHIYSKKIIDIPSQMLLRLKSNICTYNHVDDFYPVGLTNFVKKLHHKQHFNAIIVNYVILTKLFKSDLSCKKILFAHDCMSFKKIRLNLNKFWIDLTPNEEAKGIQRSDVILAIQEKEACYFSCLHPKGEIYTVYSPFSIHQQCLKQNNNILFFSGKSVLNVNGINYFISEILPIVQKIIPDVQLLIAGSICGLLKHNGNSSIKMIGTVDNVDDFYARGDIAINPIYQGTGLKIKTFEALSYGKVVIVHPHSAEGIFRPHNAPILVGNTPQEFANHLINILSNYELRQHYSYKAIDYIHSLNQYIIQQYRQILL